MSTAPLCPEPEPEPDPEPEPEDVPGDGPDDVPSPDLLWLELTHRVGLYDLGRLTALAENIAFGGADVDLRRVTAFVAYLDDLRTSIIRLDRAEEDVLWPVLRAAADRDGGPRRDLDGLRTTRTMLDADLDRVADRTSVLRAGADHGHAVAGLALALSDLRESLLVEIVITETSVLPAVHATVSVAEWEALSRTIRRRAGLTWFLLPGLFALASAAERTRLRAGWPIPLRALVQVLAVRHRRRRNRVFGPS